MDVLQLPGISALIRLQLTLYVFSKRNSQLPFHPMPFFSICIPVYKNVDYLRRLLDSVLAQSFTDYEIIITDDSPDESIGDWLKENYAGRTIQYHRHAQPMGTPENWNQSMRKAKGEWIKLMHDDDWLASTNALQVFHDAVSTNAGCKFFFSAYCNVYENTGRLEPVRMDAIDKMMFQMNPLHLFRKVYVGNPSCVLLHRSIEEWYDSQFKFVVDFEYYIRLIRQGYRWTYIDEVLINVGFHAEQVTQYTKYNPSVQLPENHQLLRLLGPSILSNLLVYEYYWRMYRNVGIRSVDEAATYDADIPAPLQRMIRFQSGISAEWLRNGFVSKLCMFAAWLSRR
jgi:glycosyltransferase involved in cell wall biosynthesis